MRIKLLWIAALGAAAAVLTACGDSAARAAAILAGGDPGRGAAHILRYGCGSCHTIAGISSARGLVGPPLTGLRNRRYVAGMLENVPENLTDWIRNPKSVNPKTAMPALGVSQRDAADIAAYLYAID